MNDAEKLATLFEKFPGIGPRQARRFVYFLLRSDSAYRTELTDTIHAVAESIHRCRICRRYYAATRAQDDNMCTICSNTDRNSTQLMIVEKDADLDTMEKSGAYDGYYFVLGWSARLTDDTLKHSALSHLYTLISGASKLEEIILALPLTTEGEHTMHLLRDALQEHITNKDLSITITTLGRGLSTGTELEYADSETLKSALAGRY